MFSIIVKLIANGQTAKNHFNFACINFCVFMVFIYKSARHDEHYYYLQSHIIRIIYCKLDGWNGSDDVSSNSTNGFTLL